MANKIIIATNMSSSCSLIYIGIVRYLHPSQVNCLLRHCPLQNPEGSMDY